MAIDKIEHHFFQRNYRNHVLQLREGQMVEGRIEKLYTDDKAKVRIGHSTLIAQLETALSIGESYYFQVNEKNDQVYLQVLQGDSMNRTADLDTLLAKMQIKPSKVNRQFVHELISSGIPFNQSELKLALQMLNNESNKDIAKQILSKMFQEKLPITENVFQALATFNTTDFSAILKNVNHLLQQNASNLTEEEAKLMELIQSFIRHPQLVEVSFNQFLLSQVKKDYQLFSMLQIMGIFDYHVPREQMIARLENYVQNYENSSFPSPLVNNPAQLQQLMSKMNEQITTLLPQQSAITRTALTSLNMYHHIQSSSLNEEEWRSLIKRLKQELIPLLPGKMGLQLGNVLEELTIHDQKQLNHLLKGLANPHIYTHLNDISKQTNQMMSENVLSPVHFEEDSIPFILNKIILQSEGRGQNIIDQKSTMMIAITSLIHSYNGIQDSSMNEEEFSSLVKSIKQEIFPLLPQQVVEQISPILERFTFENQSSVWEFLQVLANDEFYTNIANQIQVMSEGKSNQEHPVSVQQQLLAQITQYMNSIGLTMENEMMQAIQVAEQNHLDISTQSQTIKSLLLHLIQQGGQQNEHIQQLVHFINGLQLQTLTETNQMLQAQLYLPGSSFALNDDIFIRFESKKTENEQIDADYCRIMFMLDLEQLEETIVDMQVQKRIISMTIFNDKVSEVLGMESMKESMRDNLQKIDYQLSTIDWKPLSKQVEASSRNQSKQYQSFEPEGFDVKI